MKLTDTFGRRITYLRLSVTDRCNFRCRYCMPEAGVSKLRHEDVLSYEDLYRVARESVALGVEKIRVTGGEPLVRKGVVRFLERVASIPGLRELTITTNGVLLRKLAMSLRQAGVNRINVSLDSLRPGTFSTITRGGNLEEVLDGISAAEEAGFPPVKINAVLMRGVNDDEVLDFAALAARKPRTIRFIEYMPTVKEQGWKALCVTGSEVIDRIQTHYTLTPIESENMAGPAREFAIEGGSGRIGIITPISEHFCSRCNRMRVTASGLAKGCLFGNEDVDLKPYLRNRDNEALKQALQSIVGGKQSWHGLFSAERLSAPFAMSQIGG